MLTKKIYEIECLNTSHSTELHGKMVYVIKTIFPHYPHQEGTKNDPQFGHRDFSLLI